MIRKFLVFAVPAVGLMLACSSNNTSGGNPPTCSTSGGAVTGAADTHCAGVDGGAPMVQVVDPASCTADAGAADDAATADGGATDDGGAGGNGGFGDTMFNSEGDDDDCKYHLKWASTPLCQGVDAYFTVTATLKATNQPLAGAPIRPEVFLNDHHPAPNSKPTSTETSPGVYKVGPVRFDASGQWTVRFHFHEECTDLPQSPHGHAAFFVNVP